MQKSLLILWLMVSIFANRANECLGQSERGCAHLCRRFGQYAIPTNGDVALRLHPFGFENASIEPRGAGLLSFIQNKDLLAIHMETLARQILQKPDVPGENESRHIYTREAAPNTIVWARGRQVVIFPRVFLLYPKFANITIHSGDFVGTVSLRDTPNPVYKRNDPVYTHLRDDLGYVPNGSGSRRNVVYNNLLRGSSEAYEFAGSTRISREVSKFFVPSKSEREKTQSVLIVQVVRRQLNGLEYLLLFPEKSCGVLSSGGAIFRSLYRGEFEEDEWTETWEDLFGPHDFQLFDGDTVETTPADLLVFP